MSEALRILVVDDDPSMAKTLVDILTATGYDAGAVYSGAEALARVKAHPVDCVLTDIKMPQMSGVELHQALQVVQPGVPVVLMTAYSTDALVKAGLEYGALGVLAKPLDVLRVLAFFSALRTVCVIVLVDDDPAFCRTIGDILQARGFAVIPVCDPQEWEVHLKPDGQIVLLDLKLNGLSGLDILTRIKAQYPHLPVIMVTGYHEEMAASIEQALELKAYTCLYKPLEIEPLLQVLSEVRHMELSRMLGHSVRKQG